ncbi:CoA transferase [archaeon]|nr:MAG: CoA transferase [archaeon]
MQDYGASVLRIDKFSALFPDLLAAGKRSLALNLKLEEGRVLASRLIAQADVLLDPYRPGTLEAMGMSPSALHAHNERLVIARLTGYGVGAGHPHTSAAGHDINFLAMSGLLSLMHAPGGRPQPPLNLMADFAGGSAMATVGTRACANSCVRSREATARGAVRARATNRACVNSSCGAHARVRVHVRTLACVQGL